MVSSTLSCKSSRCPPSTRLGVRSLFLAVSLVLCAGASATAARADDVNIKSAEMVPVEGAFLVDATFQLSLSATLEDALNRGLVLYFVTEARLLYPRWWTLNLWNRTIASYEQLYGLSYNALTRRYQVSVGGLQQSFEKLDEALAVIGRVHTPPLVGEDRLEKGDAYIAAVRLRLDISRLPKPFQISALASSEWTLSSDWYRWTFTP